MSPLAPAGTRGYADGQRVENWDSPILFSDQMAPYAGGPATPVMDVSRYSYLAGFDTTATTPARVIISWFIDQAGGQQVGLRQFALSEQIAAAAQYRLPNLGPWCQISWAQIGAGNGTHSSRLIGTNRVHPLEFVPSSPVLIDQQNVNLAAGATATLYPTDYYAGPLSIWARIAAVTGLVWLEYLTTAGAWHQIQQATLTAATNTPLVWTTPPGAWRMNVQNTGASAQNYFLTATPSTTGAI